MKTISKIAELPSFPAELDKSNQKSLTAIKNTSNKSISRQDDNDSNYTADCAKIVTNGKVYRQMFEAEVQLNRALECVRNQRRLNQLADKPKNLKTNVTRLPVVNNINKEGFSMIGERGVMWANTILNETTFENPVHYKQVSQQLKADVDVAEPPQDEHLSSEVSNLPDIVVPKKLNSDIVERINENRRERFDVKYEEMIQSFCLISSQFEPEIAKRCSSLRENLAKSDAIIQEWLDQIDSDEKLQACSYEMLQKIWTNVLAQTQLRQDNIQTHFIQLHEMEDSRIIQIRKTIQSYAEALERVAPMSSAELQRLIDQEALEINQNLINNMRSYADLQLKLELADLGREYDQHFFWMERNDRWVRSNKSKYIKAFKDFIYSENIQNPKQVTDLLEKLKIEQTRIVAMRDDCMEEIKELIIPPKSTQDGIFAWNQKVISICKDLDKVNQEYLKEIYKTYKLVTQQCIDEMQRLQQEMIEKGVMKDPDEAKALFHGKCIPLLDELEKIFEQKLDEIDKSLNNASKANNQDLKHMFKFCQSLSYMWDKHEREILRLEKSIEEQLEMKQHNFQNKNQSDELDLDICMDNLRQESTEAGLKESLDNSRKLLNLIKNSYTEFNKQQNAISNELPNLIHTEIETYQVALCRFFGLKIHIPASPTGEKKKRQTGAATERKMHLTASSRRESVSKSQQDLRTSVDLSVVSDEASATSAALADAQKSPEKFIATKTSSTVYRILSKKQLQTELLQGGGGAQTTGGAAATTTTGGGGGANTSTAANSNVKSFGTTNSTQQLASTLSQSKYADIGFLQVIEAQIREDLARAEQLAKRKQRDEQTAAERKDREKASHARKQKEKAAKERQQHGENKEKQEDEEAEGVLLNMLEISYHLEHAELLHTAEQSFKTTIALEPQTLLDIKVFIRREILDHLDQWRLTTQRKSNDILSARQTEFNNQLELRVRLHEPRYRRAEMDVHNVRSAELLLHSERVNRHSKAVQLSLQEIRSEHAKLADVQVNWETGYREKLNKMLIEFGAATKSTRLANMNAELDNNLQAFMDGVRAYLRNIRQMVDNKLQMLRDSSASFIGSFKLFSDGGNFSPQEVEEYKNRMEKLTHKIDETETEIMSDLEGIEKRTQDTVVGLARSYEDKFRHNLTDLQFLEKISRGLTNIQANIKAEVSNCNSQSKRVEELLTNFHVNMDAVERPNLDKPNVNAFQLNASLSEIFQTLHDRSLFLNCIRTQQRPTGDKSDNSGEGASASAAGGASSTAAVAEQQPPVAKVMFNQPTPISKPGRHPNEDMGIKAIQEILKTQKHQLAEAEAIQSTSTSMSAGGPSGGPAGGMAGGPDFSNVAMIESSVAQASTSWQKKSGKKSSTGATGSARDDPPATSSGIGTAGAASSGNDAIVSNNSTAAAAVTGDDASGGRQRKKSQISVVSAAGESSSMTGGGGGGPTGATTGHQSKSSKHSARGKIAKNQRLEKRYMIFGEEQSPQDQLTFMGRINEFCRSILEGLLFAADQYYYNKGSRPTTRPMQLHDQFELCAETVIGKLQHYYQQAEAYHNECLKEFRAQLERMERAVRTLPRLIFAELAGSLHADTQHRMSQLDAEFNGRLDELDSERQRHEKALAPSLGHPNQASALAELHDAELQRVTKVQREIAARQSECRQLLLTAAVQFMCQISQLGEQLLMQFDNLLTVDEVELAKEPSILLDATELIRRQKHNKPLSDDRNVPLIPRGKATWHGADFTLITSQEGVKLGFGALSAGAVVTAKTTMGHNATIEFRDATVQKFCEQFENDLSRLKETETSQLEQLDKWKLHWESCVDSVKALY